MAFYLSNLRFDYLGSNDSDIFEQEIVFENSNYYHILANSGRGKSTLIQTLYGLKKDFNGQIKWNHEDIRQFAPEQWASLHQDQLSIVFQDLKLYPEWTAYENIEIKRQLKPFHAEKKIHDFAQQLGIANQLHHKISTLSYGEQQRVAIIRACMQPFDFILLDEPFSHLDTENIELCKNLIQQEVQVRNAGMLLCDLEKDKHFSYHVTLKL